MRSRVWRNLVRPAVAAFSHPFRILRSFSTGSFVVSVSSDTFFFDFAFFMFNLVLLLYKWKKKWAELEPDLSPKLIKIMEQRLSHIEQRSGFLHNLINQVYLCRWLCVCRIIVICSVWLQNKKQILELKWCWTFCLKIAWCLGRRVCKGKQGATETQHFHGPYKLSKSHNQGTDIRTKPST